MRKLQYQLYRFSGWFLTILNIGALDSAKILIRRLLGQHSPIKLRRSGLLVRPTNSDIAVYRQVMVERQYELRDTLIDDLRKHIISVEQRGKTAVVIDGGANVGYSSVYLAKMFPRATIVAVEPDKSTFDIMASNVATISNVRAIHGAIWKHDDGVVLSNPEDPAWARMVAEGAETTTPSFTIKSLLGMVPNAHLVLLKLDVEGAEVDIVKSSADSLRDCACIIIEPHDWMFPGRNTLAPMFTVLAGRQIDTLTAGENMVFFDTAILS